MKPFAADLWPTPKPVIEKMMAGFTPEQIAERTILEPSAGNGNIADFLAEKTKQGLGWNTKVTNIYCVEADAELRMVLSEKGYKVVGDDFLAYKKNHLFDLIVMNPPFDCGAAHLLKAWEVLNGGDIVSLLNAETIRNPHSRDRELLKKIIEENGSVEFIGNAFSRADRKTDVEVALVRLHKKTPEVVFDFFENKTTESAVRMEEFSGDNLPAMKDAFGNLEIMYDEARKACVETMQSRSKLEYYLKHLTGDSDHDDVTKAKTFNEMIDIVKKKAWNYLFSRTKLAEVMTQKVREDFERFQKEKSGMDFTKENIINLLGTLVSNRGEIMKQCILDAFEKMTRYDKKNTVHVEGWKTNDAWCVNKKVIIPWGCRFGWSGGPEINHEKDRELADIEKALCFISGQKFEGYNSSIYEAVSKRVNFGEWIATRFFDVKLFKKGTIHLQFRDDWLLQEFNVRAAQFKNWLPDDYNRREKSVK